MKSYILVQFSHFYYISYQLTQPLNTKSQSNKRIEIIINFNNNCNIFKAFISYAISSPNRVHLKISQGWNLSAKCCFLLLCHRVALSYFNNNSISVNKASILISLPLFTKNMSWEEIIKRMQVDILFWRYQINMKVIRQFKILLIEFQVLHFIPTPDKNFFFEANIIVSNILKFSNKYRPNWHKKGLKSTEVN